MTLPVALVDGLLAGRYRLSARIATGGTGEVWRATDVVLDRPVAVKTLRPDAAADPEARARFRDEARHAAALQHPGIAQVYDYGEQGGPAGPAWLVMELVEGRPLQDVLADGPLPVADALHVVGQAGLALDAAHRAGVVHRDVKPGNLMVRPDGTVSVTDFGIAALAGGGALPGAVVGTAYYLSPEQAQGAPALPASDVYSLGVVAHECLTGERPFSGADADAVAAAHLHDDPPPLPSTVPAEVRALVAAALAKLPQDRPASAGELGRRALALREELLAGRPHEPEHDPADDPAARAGRDPRHARALRLALAMLVVVAVGLLARSCAEPSSRASAPEGGRAAVTAVPASPTAGTVAPVEPAAGARPAAARAGTGR